MKNTLTILFLFAAGLIYGQTANPACTFNNPTPIKTTKGVNPTFTPPVNPPNTRPKPPGDKRIIYWIHGLGGSTDSWVRPAEVTAYQSPGNKIPGYPPRKVESLNLTYSQFTLSGAGYNLHTKLVTAGDALCAANKITDKSTNFIIAHSQGGLVSRAADKYYADQGIEEERRFGGIVTFGSPHLGARILNNQDLHAPMINEGCEALADGPVKAKVYATTLIPFFGYPIADKLSDIGDKVCNFLTQAILPTMIEGQQQPITSDYKVGAPALEELNGYESTLPRVACFGEEKDPVAWRQMYSFYVKKPVEFPVFEANQDDLLVNKVGDLRDHYYSKYLLWKGIAIALISSPWPPYHLKIPSILFARRVSKGYHRGYTWLTDANEKYMSVIGAITQKTTTQTITECQCQTTDYEGKVTYSTWYANDPSECPVSSSTYESCGPITTTLVNTQTVTLPNDGAVIAESAAGFSGAVQVRMKDSNHQQMRNDKNTKDVLLNLFDGNYGKYFITETQ